VAERPVGIRLARVPASLAARFVARFAEPFTDGLTIEPALNGDLGRSQVQLPTSGAS
jgi:hypothetical protein